MQVDDDNDDSSFYPSDGEYTVDSSESSVFEGYDSEEDMAVDEIGPEWQSRKLGGGHVTLHFDNIDAVFQQRMAEQVTVLKKRVDDKRKMMNSQDKNRMSDATWMTNCFAPSELFLLLKDTANRNRPDDSPNIEMREIELVVHLIFGLAVYDTSLECCCEFPSVYTLVAETVAQFKGGLDRAKLVLSGLDCYENHSRHHGTVWSTPFRTNPFLNKLEYQITTACSSMVFERGVSDLIVDDDKMRNRLKTGD